MLRLAFAAAALTAEASTPTSPPTASPACSTVEGVECVFPFEYQSKTYNHCTTVDHSEAWCATAPVYAEKRWGVCGPNCEGYTFNKEMCLHRPGVSEQAEARRLSGASPSQCKWAQCDAGGGDHESRHAAPGDNARRLSGGGQPVSDATMTSAYFMLFFVAFNTTLLYLFNYNHPDIRKICRLMICMSLVVYIAVLVNEALAKLFYLTGKYVAENTIETATGIECREAEVQIAGRAFVFIVFVILLNWLCWRCRNDMSWLAGTSLLWGHLTAFAGIGAFGYMTHSFIFIEAVQANLPEIFHSGPGMHLLVCGVAAVILISMLVIGSLLRYRFGRKDQSSTYDEPWMHEVLEGEQDATALILGYLTLDVVVVGVRQDPQPCGLHGCNIGEICSSREVKAMFAATFIFLVLLVIYCSLKFNLEKKVRDRGFETAWSTGCSRFCSFFHLRMYLASAMAWCLISAIEWMTMYLAPCGELPSLRIMSAFCCTAVAILTVIFFNYFFGEKFEAIPPEELEVQQLQTQEEPVEGQHTHEAHKPVFLVHDVALGFAFAIGLAWERAFQVIENTIITGTPTTQSHPVTYTFLMSFALVAIVLPAFMWYVVPHSRMSREEHVRQLHRESRRKIHRRRPETHRTLLLGEPESPAPEDAESPPQAATATATE